MEAAYFSGSIDRAPADTQRDGKILDVALIRFKMLMASDHPALIYTVEWWLRPLELIHLTPTSLPIFKIYEFGDECGDECSFNIYI